MNWYFFIGLVIILNGCATYDPMAIAMLNDRISKLESASKQRALQIEEHDKQCAIIWISGSNGSSIPVKISQKPNGFYMGPKGEFYRTFPTSQQLQKIYSY